MNKIIEFIEDYEVKSEGGRVYKKGQQVTMPTASARHFLRRNKAKVVDAEPKKDEPKKRGPKPKNLGDNSVRSEPDTRTSRLLPGSRKGFSDQ